MIFQIRLKKEELIRTSTSKNELENKLHELEQKENSWIRQKETLENKCKLLEQSKSEQKSELERQNKIINHKNQEQQFTQTSMSNEMQLLQQEIERLKQQQDAKATDLNQGIQHYKQECVSKNNYIQQLQNEIEALTNRMYELNNNKDEMGQALQNKNEEIQNSNNKLNEHRNRIDALEQEKSRMQQMIHQQNNQLQQQQIVDSKLDVIKESDAQKLLHEMPVIDEGVTQMVHSILWKKFTSQYKQNNAPFEFGRLLSKQTRKLFIKVYDNYLKEDEFNKLAYITLLSIHVERYHIQLNSGMYEQYPNDLEMFNAQRRVISEMVEVAPCLRIKANSQSNVRRSPRTRTDDENDQQQQQEEEEEKVVNENSTPTTANSSLPPLSTSTPRARTASPSPKNPTRSQTPQQIRCASVSKESARLRTLGPLRLRGSSPVKAEQMQSGGDMTVQISHEHSAIVLEKATELRHSHDFQEGTDDCNISHFLEATTSPALMQGFH